MSLVHNYISMLGLNKLKPAATGYMFRCPFCGDSTKKPNKRSAYILEADSDNPYFYCHRCQYTCDPSNHFPNFLREMDYNIWASYMEEYKRLNMFNMDDKNDVPDKAIDVVFTKRVIKGLDRYKKWLRTLSSSSNDDDILRYMINRKISSDHFDSIFRFVGNPYSLFRKIFDTKQYEEKSGYNISHRGVLVPFLNDNQESAGFGIRMIGENSPGRFINLIQEGSDNFLFGENNVDWNDDIYIVEGMIDKITMDNDKQFLSMTSSNQKIEYVKSKAKGNVTYVYDFEYDNRYICRSIDKVIDAGFSVFLAPHTLNNVKDINDLKTVYDMNDKDILDLIRDNVYNGFDATMMLQEKIDQAKSRLLY